MTDVRLILGDCREALSNVESESVDVIITDPPFGIVHRFGSNQGPRGKRTMQFDWDNEETTRMVIEGLTTAFTKLKPNGSAFVFCGFDQVGVIIPVFREAGLTAKPACWVKSCPVPAAPGNWWPSGFEVAVYGYRSGAWFGDDDPKRSNVFVGDTMRHGQPGKTAHPTQKPLWIMRRIVRSICPLKGVVLDPFCGSGTTLVACMKEARNSVGIEINPDYMAIAERRIAEARCPLFDLWETPR